MARIEQAPPPGWQLGPRLLTRNGKHEVATYRRPEADPARLRAAAELWKQSRPNAKLRSSAGSYNCVGLVFASRRWWIESTDLRGLLVNDLYRQISVNEAQAGDLVVYKLPQSNEDAHVGVILSRDIVTDALSLGMLVLSKWGQDGEYIHQAEDVPDILGQPSEFWTDRREL